MEEFTVDEDHVVSYRIHPLTELMLELFEDFEASMLMWMYLEMLDWVDEGRDHYLVRIVLYDIHSCDWVANAANPLDDDDLVDTLDKLDNDA